MTGLAMATMISGRRAEHLGSPVRPEDKPLFNTTMSLMGEESQMGQRILPYPTEENLQTQRSPSLRVEAQNRPMTPYSTSPSSTHELFFDCLSTVQVPTTAPVEERASTSYLVFEPVVEKDFNFENTDWRRYDLPPELLRSQEGISHGLKGLLAPSIERIRAQHTEEEERRAATSRKGRPLARAGRASVKPRRQIHISGALDTTHLTPPSRLSATSDTSLSPNDFGYGSTSPGTEPSRSPGSPKRRSFGLGALFRRKERTVVSMEELDENNLPRPQSSETWPFPETLLPPPQTRPGPVRGSLTGECVSCLEEFATGELVILTCHSYCNGCFQQLIANALESEIHWPPKCCLNPIPHTSIIPHLTSTALRRYRQRSSEWSIPAGDRIYCAQPTCSAWIPPKHIRTLSHAAICPKCAHRSCTICRGPHHGSDDCPSDPALLATMNLAKMEGWKRCYSCHALVAHNKGCRHMTCRCKAQFCYICGNQEWRTCGCTDAQLVGIQQRAETRRADEAVQNTRAIREAEEERAAIRAVEDLMWAEEDRFLREIEAESRRAEEQRRKEEEVQRRREEKRIAAVNRKFRGLNAELEALGDVQRVLMAERYEFETEVLKKERQDAIDTLYIRHPAELQYLVNESASKINATKSKLDNEYTARLAEERRVEIHYVDELREFWRGKPEGGNKVREARDELRRDQDKEYRSWDAYRRQQLESVMDGERKKMDALRVKQKAEIKAVDGRAKIDGLEWRRKNFAEGRWVEEVTRERVTMLGEMEGMEYARGS